MRRLAHATITLVCLAFLVPGLVLTFAALGLQPRHWSGIALADVQLPRVRPAVKWGDARNPRQDDVADGLITIPYGGWQAVGPGADGLVYIKTSRISPPLFPVLGERFGGATVGVVYSPLEKAPQRAKDGYDPYHETWWQRMDPLGSWWTLAYGFPWQLGLGCLLAVGAWLIVLWRRNIKQRRLALA